MKKNWGYIIGVSLFGLVVLSSFNSKPSISSLTDNQKTHVSQLHSSVRPTFINFIKEVEKTTGLEVYITSSYRTWKKQAILKKQNSSNASPGKSRHNYGIALDFNLRNRKTKKIILRKSTSISTWKKYKVHTIAKKHKLIWGGNFKTYHDPIHVAFPYNTSKLKTQAVNQFCSGSNNRYCPDKVQGNKVKLSA